MWAVEAVDTGQCGQVKPYLDVALSFLCTGYIYRKKQNPQKFLVFE